MNLIHTRKMFALAVSILLFTQNTYADDTQTPLINKNILQIGTSQTFVTDALKQNNNISIANNVTTNLTASDLNANTQVSVQTVEDSIKKQISSADIVYANLKDMTETNDELNAYITEAIKQKKLLVFENMANRKLTSFPMTFDAEVVVVKPGTGTPDKIVTFGTQESIIEYSIQEATKKAEEPIIYSPINSQYEENPAVLPQSFDDMIDYQREQALNQITEQINILLTPSTTLMQTSTSSSGGQIGYPCPSEAKEEQLCFSAIITNAVYSYDDGSAKINVIHGYSYSAYRTDLGTSIFVSPYGSANPTLTSNSSSSRGYFLKQVRPEINVEQASAAGMILFRRTPENQNGSTSVSTSSGMSYTVDAKVAEKPSLGGSISYSTSQSQSTNLSDWTTTTTSDTGYDADWDYHLNKYKSIGDWVSQKVFQKAKLASIPSISANGVQYSSEAIWFGSPNNVTGDFKFNVWSYVVNERIYFTSNDIFGWKASSHRWTYSLYSGGQTFDTNWLKTL
ncbi:hypothetical protein [Shewanella surugensis]|uniref:Uncharacterized protein n=1 Tax=Shewanella surugensis TaxID=212020 RepID=A0ABT0LG00_9GAMM|nr:hypothetical protein [Shewanella surugensis]MCL1126614.1 hypothetical protein [Shewanella surugensis]